MRGSKSGNVRLPLTVPHSTGPSHATVTQRLRDGYTTGPSHATSRSATVTSSSSSSFRSCRRSARRLRRSWPAWAVSPLRACRSSCLRRSTWEALRAQKVRNRCDRCNRSSDTYGTARSESARRPIFGAWHSSSCGEFFRRRPVSFCGETSHHSSVISHPSSVYICHESSVISLLLR